MPPPETGSRSRLRPRSSWRRAAPAAAAVAWLLIGLGAAFAYVNNYDQHRGFAAVGRLGGIRAGRLEWVHFHSAALRRAADYLVYLPTGYDPSRRYPVFYLLHGVPGRPQAFIRIASMDARLDNLISLHLIPPMLLVFPDGRIGGDTQSDSEWANTRSGNFDTYVIDVVRNVDQRFPTVARALGRVIAGYSAGAYGAINIALHHPDVFGAVQIWSGYFVQIPTGVFRHASPAQLHWNSPIEYLAHPPSILRRPRLRVFLFSGRGDHSRPDVAHMTTALQRAGAIVDSALYPGGHDWGLWTAHIDQMLILAGREVSKAGRVAIPPPPTRPPPSPARLRAASSAGPPTAGPAGQRVLLPPVVRLASACCSV